jgi:hypothetical protein
MQALDKFGRFTDSGNSEILTAWLTKSIQYRYSPANARLEGFPCSYREEKVPEPPV